MDFKDKIKDRITDIESQQKEILRRLKDNKNDIDTIIDYGNDLYRLKLRISELNLMLWQ